jgi:PKD repeat protein
LTGPSELALSLAVTATPDVITQDGQSQAVVDIFARDPSNQPVAGLGLRIETYVNGVPTDFGVLSSKTASTGTDGRARITYRAPAAPPPSQDSDVVVSVAVTPVGTDYNAASARHIAIRLARPGIILPANGTPVAQFFFSPSAPRVDDDVFFDGSASKDDGQIVSYHWSFGDGRTATSSSPTTRHHYSLAGSYSVVLTVTDDRGVSASSAPVEVTVGPAAAPTAVFVTSPASPKANTAVGFNASASQATEGRTIVEYVWDFGDGTPVVTVGGPLVTHAYAAPGSYVVTLKVVDDTDKFAVVSSTLGIAP